MWRRHEPCKVLVANRNLSDCTSVRRLACVLVEHNLLLLFHDRARSTPFFTNLHFAVSPVCPCAVNLAEPSPRQQPGACRTQPYHAQAATAHAHGNTKGTSSLRCCSVTITYQYRAYGGGGGVRVRSVCAHRSNVSSGERLDLCNVSNLCVAENDGLKSSMIVKAVVYSHSICSTFLCETGCHRS